MPKMRPRIYLDFAAATPIDPRVMKEMRKFENEFFGNPNSAHWEGQGSRAKIDFMRAQISDFFHCSPQEIIFTSGATESNNLAIQGVVSHYLATHNRKPHVITTTLEHQSVYNPIKELEKTGAIEATFVTPNPDGTIDASDIVKEIKNNTVLISVIFVSNEIGSVLPIRKLGGLLSEYRQKHKQKIYFHTDAVQAVKYYNCHAGKLNVDLLTFSGHKIYGPKGIGGLFVKTGTRLAGILHGGAQEYGLRAGTQNTAGIIGMAKAFSLLGNLEERQNAGLQARKIRDKIRQGLQKHSKIIFNTPAKEELSCPDILNFLIKGMDQEILIAKLDSEGIAVSTGSACVSGSVKPSHVILSLNKKIPRPFSAARISIGKGITLSDADSVIKKISEIA
jgi:cysteine desulfurase